MFLFTKFSLMVEKTFIWMPSILAKCRCYSNLFFNCKIMYDKYSKISYKKPFNKARQSKNIDVEYRTKKPISTSIFDIFLKFSISIFRYSIFFFHGRYRYFDISMSIFSIFRHRYIDIAEPCYWTVTIDMLISRLWIFCTSDSSYTCTYA